MIKYNIQIKYIHHYNSIINFVENIFVADYTEQTKTLAIKRGVEFFSLNPPADINYLSITNNPKLSIDGIKFNNQSFVYGNGNPKSQCEAVFFPSTSDKDSWILFCELKYSSIPLNNSNNLRKSIRQLYKTRYYYFQDNIILDTNNCYLVASLPMQSEPFTNFSITQAFLTKLKSSRNIVLRMKNYIEIIDENVITV
jgi:hypothetical protein